MKKILLLPLIAAAAFTAPQPAVASSLDAPLCQRSMLLPVSTGVRCFNGSKFCNVWIWTVDQELGVRQPEVCI